MPITSQVSRVAYAGNGSATTFPTTFKFLDSEHVQCVRTTADGEDVLLEQDTDYAVSGAGEESGGTVTFPAASSDYGVLAEGQTLTIYREVPLTQETDWENSDEIDVEEIESADDKLTMIAQQQEDKIGRAIKVPVSSSLSDVECQAPEAGKALVWNDVGDGIVNGTVDLTTLGATARREEFTAADGQTLFELTTFTYTPSADNLAVYVDGVLLDSSEYTKTSTSSFTLATPAVEGEIVTAVSAELAAMSDINAATDAAESAQSAAEDAQADAESARDDAQTYAANAGNSATNALSSEVDAGNYAGQAETARDEAEAAAAGVNLPSVAAGDADKLLQVKDDESGYELKALSSLLAGYLQALLDASPDTDHSVSGIKATFTAGENLAFGDVCYLKSDGKMWKADADAAATMPVVAMAAESISADASGEFLLFGFARDDSWSWTVGGEVYASTTAGGLTQTAPTGVGDFIQPVGLAVSSSVVHFAPDLTAVEITE
jgi:hypothetical protein